MPRALKTNSYLLFLLLVIIIPIVSCKKSSHPVSGNSYTWNWKGNNYEASFKVAHPGGAASIIARTEDPASPTNITIGITLSSLEVGMYTFGSLTNDSFSLVEANGILFKGDIITLNISSNSNNLLSGSFSGTLREYSNYNSAFPITGYFTNIPIQN